MCLRELQRSRKGGIIKHVREETEKTLQYQIQCKAKYTSVFHYNHTPNTTFPLCLNYLSFLIKIDSPFLTCSFHLPYFSFQQKNNLAALPTGSNENCQHMMLIFLRSTLLHQRFSGLERFLLVFFMVDHGSSKLQSKWSFTSITFHPTSSTMTCN